MNEILVANRWYPEYKGAGRSYKATYPTPQSILRRTVDVAEYKFICKSANINHIRAACVIPAHLPFTHLTHTPWSLIYKTKEWVMIIASVEDQNKWLDLCRASGAIAWQRSHNQTNVYKWAPPELDSQGFEIRPPNALGITIPVGVRKDFNKPKKDYDRAALVDDIRADQLNYSQIGLKYGLSRITVQGIAKREGIRKKAPHHGGSSKAIKEIV